MIQHVVAFTWNDSVPLGHADICVQTLMAMSREIDSIREYRCGADLAMSTPATADFIIVATFDDIEGWRKYDEHPLHNQVRIQYFKPYLASRTAGQFIY